MVSSSEHIARIRELESLILDDRKHTNSLLEVKTLFLEKNAASVQMAAMHTLRRIFIQLLEDGVMADDASAKKKRKTGSSETGTQQFVAWLQAQFAGYMDGLCSWMRSGNGEKQAPAIRTVMEFVGRESRMHVSKGPLSFGIKTYRKLMTHVLACPSTNDVELLVMMRDEIFEQPDCGYYALQIIKESIRDFKEGGDDIKMDKKQAWAFTQNAFDLLRIMAIPTDVDEDSLLVAVADDTSDGEEGDELDNDTDSSDDEDARKGSKKRKVADKGKIKDKGKTRLTLRQKLCDPLSHKRVFSKAWLLLLSLPLSAAQHRLVLRHLPDHVIPELVSPLLLGDYLTQSYEMGGVIAVLSLESLFILIAEHNLDYPKFFLSLYKLCTPKVFSAKYRSKFMRLLQMALQSTNLPAYVVGAFVKRLMGLALTAPAPAAQFCIAQSTWLLRRHPQSQTLIHASTAGGGKMGKKKAQETMSEFNALEEEDLELAGALGSQSSLWEAALLEHHHYHAVASMAASLRKVGSTAPESLIGKPGLAEDEVPIPIHVPEFIDHSYAGFMDAELDKVRKSHGAPLAIHKPGSGEGTLISQCFGGF